MWAFNQRTGAISRNGRKLSSGYAGLHEGKNNPAMEAVHDKGPLPRGRYTFGEPHKHPTLGLYVMALTPDPLNRMFGRSAFYIHGDSAKHPGEASHGCIVTDATTRKLMWTSQDHDLEVVCPEAT